MAELPRRTPSWPGSLAFYGRARAPTSAPLGARVIGVAAGSRSPVRSGALIGVLAGRAVDYFWANLRGARVAGRQAEAAADARWREELIRIFAAPAETRRIAFATAVIVLGAKLAKADGRNAAHDRIAEERNLR